VVLQFLEQLFLHVRTEAVLSHASHLTDPLQVQMFSDDQYSTEKYLKQIHTLSTLSGRIIYKQTVKTHNQHPHFLLSSVEIVNHHYWKEKNRVFWWF
jgi:hypothetical protein